MNGLFIDGVLLDIRIKSWSFQASLKPKDLNIEKKDIPSFVRLGQKYLFRRELINRFASIRTLVDYYTSKYSFAFPIGGAQFVPYKSLPIVLTNLKQLKQEFIDVTNKFISEYDNERQEMFKKHEQYVSVLVDAYPEPTSLANKFSFDWVIFEIGNTKPMTDKKLLKELKEHQIFDAEVADYQNKLRNKIDDFLDNTVLSLRGEAAKICQKIVDKIDKQEIISEKSVNALKDLVDRVSILNFVDDKNLEQSLEDLRNKITTGKDISISSSLQDLIREGANKVIKLADNISDMKSTIDSYKSRKINFKLVER